MNLERAIEIAVEAHKGQTDKAGAIYILHPLRVMMSLETEVERTTGILHDVVEDSEWTLEMLSDEGFSDEVIEALRCLTKIDGESYEDFILRVCENDLARQVKISDVTDNMDLNRIKAPTEIDFQRAQKYGNALSLLNKRKAPE